MQNNYFSCHSQYYHQIRGGAMGSPLTLTIANCYMFFFEQQIVKQINNSGGLYLRYIDDIFIVVNWPERHFQKQIEQWNEFDSNIKLNPQINKIISFLDLHIENRQGKLITKVHHKPSYEAYYLPFNSIHPLHIKMNIPFAMILRAIRYCSTFETFTQERESLRLSLLLNRYPNKLIEEQFQKMFEKFNTKQPRTASEYITIRSKIISTPIKEKTQTDYEYNMFVHFTFCSSMKHFPRQFHLLWHKYFETSPINDVKPVLGTRNSDNLLRTLIEKKVPV